MHRVLDRPLQAREIAALLTRALAQNEQDGALHVVALLGTALGFRGDAPAGGHLQTRRPEDLGEVGPDPHVLMGEHHQLQAVVGHVRRHR